MPSGDMDSMGPSFPVERTPSLDELPEPEAMPTLPPEPVVVEKSLADLSPPEEAVVERSLDELPLPEEIAEPVEEPSEEKPKAKPAKRRRKKVEAEEPAEEIPVDRVPDEETEWFVLKVQSNRENSIKAAILRRIKIAGQERNVAEVIVPTEKVTEMKGGKKRVMERKFYPGYIIVRLKLDEETWFTIRETPGVGDFVGAGGKPVPMTTDDVMRMLGRKEKAEEEKQPRLQINFAKGDRVKIKEGAFENFEGDVDEVIESKGLVRVMVNVFNRPTPVELEYWQVETV
jgi:transcriptional antiterminator NusG